MFSSLKSLLSVHVAPGASHVSVSPFSFAWGAKISVRANAGDDVIEREKLIAELMEIDRILEADDLPAGRERVKAILQNLTE
jgi:hypothetical protein